MGEKREEVVNKMRRLELTTAEDLSGKAADCHLRPIEGRRKNTKEKCPLCLVHNVIEDYESLLFAMDERNNAGAEEEEVVDEGDPEGAVLEQLRRGTWADSQAEKDAQIPSPVYPQTALQFKGDPGRRADPFEAGGLVEERVSSVESRLEIHER